MGRLANESEISRVASTHWAVGTDASKLARAAHHFNCDLPIIRRRDEEGAFRSLSQYASKRVPCLLCLDDWGHWVTVVRNDRDRFVMLDSKTDPVLQVINWPTLRKRWRYQEKSQKPFFDLLPVRSRSTTHALADFSVVRAKFLRRPENHLLANYWDDYLEDLMKICEGASKRFHSTIPMSEFLRRNQELFISRIAYWHGHIDPSAVRKLVGNFRFVASTYGLKLPAPHQKQALIDMSILIAMWTSSKKGIDPIYGSDE